MCGAYVSLVVKISLHTPFCGCCGKCSIERKLKIDGFWSVLLYILILFCLKNVHCLPMLASAARWLIARGLGGISISSRKFLRKWNKIL